MTKNLRQRTGRGLRAGAAALVLVTVAAGCGSDGEEPDRASVDTSTGETGGTDVTATDDPAVDPGTTGATTDGDATTDEGSDGGGGGEGDGADDPGEDSGPPADLTSDQICAAVPAAALGGALGRNDVVAAPGQSETPQCSYALPGDAPSEVTVSALRSQGDLAGRVGAEAFDYVVETNLAIAKGQDVAQRPLTVGDEGVVLSGANVHMGVLRFGSRIVTVIVSSATGTADDVAAIAQTLGPLAP